MQSNGNPFQSLVYAKKIFCDSIFQLDSNNRCSIVAKGTTNIYGLHDAYMIEMLNAGHVDCLFVPSPPARYLG